MGWRTLLTGRWSGPFLVGAAVGGALVAGSVLREQAYGEKRWPRHLTVIERAVPTSGQAAFMERLCSEGRERGFRCEVGAGQGDFQPVRYIELWEGDVHITALAIDLVPVIRIQLFADVGDQRGAEEEWLRSL